MKDNLDKWVLKRSPPLVVQDSVVPECHLALLNACVHRLGSELHRQVILPLAKNWMPTMDADVVDNE